MLFSSMIPTFVGNMLYTSPAFLAINIRLQELPGGGETTFDFMVRRLIGGSG